MANKWRTIPKGLLAVLAWNPNEPKKLDPLRLHCPTCGSTVFQVIKEKRPFKIHRRAANRKRHTMVCASCLGNAAFFEA